MLAPCAKLHFPMRKIFRNTEKKFMALHIISRSDSILLCFIDVKFAKEVAISRYLR